MSSNTGERRRGQFRWWVVVWLWIGCLGPVLAQDGGYGSLAIENAIDRLLRSSHLKGADIGVVVKSLDDGQMLYERNPLNPLITASNTKLVTTAASLGVLGEGFQFETRFGLRGNPGENGVFLGDLIVEGEGDPGLGARFHHGDPVGAFRALAAALRERDIRTIRGSLVLDTTAFDDEYVAPGWPQNQLDREYCAPVSALPLTENCVDVLIGPGSAIGARATARLAPATSLLGFENTCETFSKLKRGQGPKLFRYQETIRVSGEVRLGDGESRFVLSVPDPDAYFADVLLRTLAEEGIRIEGSTRRAGSGGANLDDRERVYTHRTPLEQVVLVINKESQNFFAECLFKRLARQRYPEQPATFALAGSVVREYLDQLGVPSEHVESADGSGLSRDNRYAPAHLVRLLEAAYRGPYRQIFVSSLPISGVDGTLDDRMGGAAYRGRVRAKTGYIRQVSALSGFIRTRSDRTLVFSILFNGFKSGNAHMKKIQDDICRTLIDGM